MSGLAVIKEAISSRDTTYILVEHSTGYISYPFVCFHFVSFDRFTVDAIDFYTYNMEYIDNDRELEIIIKFIVDNLSGKWFLTNGDKADFLIFGFELEEDLTIFKLFWDGK